MELAASAGLHMDPWQQHVLKGALGEREDGTWSAFEVGLIVPRQNGKGAVIEARELAGLFLFGEETIIHSAQLFDTSVKAFERILRLIESEPAFEKRVKRVSHGHGSEGIWLKNGSELLFKARTQHSARGFSCDCVILDEAYNLSPEAMAAMLPTLAARPNPQIWYTSSAGMQASDQLRRVRERGMASDPDRLAFFEWSCDHGVDTSDPHAWAQANPAMGIRISSEFIAAMRNSLPETEFKREHLGVWADAGGGAIDVAQWASLMDPLSRRDGAVSLAVDIAPTRDYASIAMYGRRADGRGHMQLVDYRPGTDWLVARIVELHGALGPVAVGMGRGTAASLEVELNKHGIARPENVEEPRPGELAVATATDMAAATGQMLDAVKQASLRHIGQQELDTSVAGAQTREREDSLAWARKDSNADTSPLVAVTLARWSFESRAHLIKPGSYDLLSSVW